ncbi:enhancer of mRNA-decapping protein 4 homolog [Anopheles bellator]|uniref:enhancer of mRNA-decapping protein 4 homolog n=1 Tax=Anopheles bellator TaxID=139047 RepID=UPI002649BE57|nr:enhancer of mRNA-decapping protein 4 homolog [Anopheles bellator]
METKAVSKKAATGASPATKGSKRTTFTFSADERQHSFKTSDKSIKVVCSGGTHDRGSSKIKLINMVDYKWEQKNYPGRLIACHKERDVMAYAIKVTKHSKSEGMVRVVHLQACDRVLIKGMSGEVLDIQFAHTSTPDCLLGIIEPTALHVHHVQLQDKKLTTTLKVKINDPLEGHVPVCDRISWCPYLREPEDEVDDFASQLLVWTRGSTFQCYSVSTLAKAAGDPTNLSAWMLNEAGFKATDGEATITGSVLSADGTTLALSSADGLIRFYQVYQHSNDYTPRCLHEWKPHDGKVLNSFFFLDDYTETVDDNTLWKHAITCAENNTEIKLWCCESWECLQTVRLTAGSPNQAPLNLRAEIDLASTYLVLSDMSNRQLYVMQIRKGVANLHDPQQHRALVSQSKSGTSSLRGKVAVPKTLEQMALQRPHIVSIAEYPVSTPILCFSILYATVRTQKFGDAYLMRMMDDDDEDRNVQSSVVLRMFLLQPNSLQNCKLVYNAVPEEVADTESAMAGNSDEAVAEEDEEEVAGELEGNLSEDDDRAKGVTVPASSSKESPASGSSREDDEDENGEGGKKKDSGRDADQQRDTFERTMVAAVKKLNEAIRVQTDLSSSVDTTPNGGTGIVSTTPAMVNKVNLMTPDSFSTPTTGGASSERPANWIQSYADRGALRGGQYDQLAVKTDQNTAASAAAGLMTPCGNNNSSATSTTDASGSDGCTSDDEEEEEEEEEGGGNTSIASIAGSERIANTTDDPDDVEEDVQEEGIEEKAIGCSDAGDSDRQQRVAVAALSNGVPSEQKIKHKRVPSGGNVMLNASSTMLTVEHFSKILTLDEAEPATVREKNKSDETVNPSVLSTLFMLANATKQQQHLHPAQPKVVELIEATDSQRVAKTTTATTAGGVAPPTANALEAFVNMVNSRAATEETKSGGLTVPSKLRKSATNGEVMSESGVKADTPIVPPMPSVEMLASGGSSPSREVQQIMSTKGGTSMVDELFQYMCSDRQDTSPDEELNADDDGDEDESMLVASYDDEQEVEVENEKTLACNRSDQTDGTGDGNEKEAAMVGVLKNAANTSGVVSSKEEKAKPMAKETINRSSPVRESTLDARPPQPDFWPTTVPKEVSNPDTHLAVESEAIALPHAPPPTPAAVAIDTTPQLTALSGKMDRMMELLLLQSRQIEQLNTQIEALKKGKNDDHRRYQAATNRLQQTLPKAIETQLIAFCQQQAHRTEEQLRSVFTVLLAQIVGTLENRLPKAGMPERIPEQFRAALLKDIQGFVLPPITAKIDGMQQMLAMAKLRSNAAVIKDAVQETILSPPILDALSTSVQKGMQTNQEQIYQASLRDIMLPGYEKSSQELFRQLNEAFTVGITGFLRRIDFHLMRMIRFQGQAVDLVEKVRVLPEKLAADGERVTATALQSLRESIEKDLKVMHTPLLKTIRDNIRQEIEKGFEAQASSLEDSVLSAVRSQAQTPAPNNVDVQEQIRQYLAGGQINKAFHKALLSNDLSLVEFVLDRADYKQVFNPCTLEQTVLLSLIQQISADMSNHNDLKHKYLSDAIVSLDFQDPVTKEHSPKVMLELINNSQAFMSANPSSSLCTSLKMLVSAVQFMGYKQF